MKKVYVLCTLMLMGGFIFAQTNHLNNGSVSVKEGINLVNSPFSAVTGKIINNNVSYKVVIDSLHYDGNPGQGIGTGGAGTFEVYAFFSAASLSAHHSAGNNITMVKVYIMDATKVTSAQIKMYSNQGTTLVYSQVFTPAQGWNFVTLTTPLTIPATDLYIGYQAVVTGGYPLGCDANAANPNGNWIVYQGTWYHLTDIGVSNGNWNIRAMVSGTQLTNEIKLVSTFGDFASFSYCEVVPLSQAITYDLKGAVLNAGSATQTNVTLHAEDATNGINGTASTSSIATGIQDTLTYTVTLNTTTPKVYGVKMYATQNETDQVPANNVGDSIYFQTDNSLYLRTSNFNSVLTPYSFGTSAPATTGMEYGANYVFLNNDQVDSIFVVIYRAHGTGNLVGKLYNVDLQTGDRTVVAQTNSYTPTGTPEIKELALITPYQITTASVLTATVQLNCNISVSDSIYIGANGGFPGDASVAGAAYLKVNNVWGWYYVQGTCPIVGIIVHHANEVNPINLTSNIAIYPNPVSNTMYVMNEKAVNVEIYNLQGQCVAKYFNENVINVADLAQGTYLVKVTTNNKVITQKINIVR